MTNRAPARKRRAEGPSVIRDGIVNYHFNKRMDVIFFCLVIVILVLGLSMLYSAYGSRALSQMIIAAASVGLMLVVSLVDFRLLNSIIAPLLAVITGILYTIAILQNSGTNRRWINNVPIVGQFQPSEIAKFSLVLSMAYLGAILSPVMRGRGEKKIAVTKNLTSFERALLRRVDTRLKGTALLICVILYHTIFLVPSRHLSGFMILLLIGYCMLWYCGASERLLVFVGVLAFLMVVLVLIKPEIAKIFGEHSYERVVEFTSKEKDYLGEYWQTYNGLLALGTGGFFGVGIGRSVQKLGYISAAENDFILPVICEETGFFGVLVIVLIFCFLAQRGFSIAKKSQDLFGSLMVSGIMSQILIQVMLNICVVTDSIPNTGIPLPFFSKGGTALLILLMQMGLVLSVSRVSKIDKL